MGASGPGVAGVRAHPDVLVPQPRAGLLTGVCMGPSGPGVAGVRAHPDVLVPRRRAGLLTGFAWGPQGLGSPACARILMSWFLNREQGC